MLVHRERRLGSAPKARSWRAKLAAVSASPEEKCKKKKKLCLLGNGCITEDLSAVSDYSETVDEQQHLTELC